MTFIGWVKNTLLAKRRTAGLLSVSTVETDDPCKGVRIKFHDYESFEYLTIEIEIMEWEKIAARVTEHINDMRTKYAKTLCSVCNEPQYATKSGMTCKNGHGGAPSIEKA